MFFVYLKSTFSRARIKEAAKKECLTWSEPPPLPPQSAKGGCPKNMSVKGGGGGGGGGKKKLSFCLGGKKWFLK